MREKELRLGLVCYGGISLAVYMHGVTKEIWHVVRASAARRRGERAAGAEGVYQAVLGRLAAGGLRLDVLCDIIAGASAGGLNGVFLAQAIHAGQSLEPLTRLWLERADVDVLLAPDAQVWTGFAKQWAVPLVRWLLARPGGGLADSLAPETRAEVSAKLARLVRSRWLAAPFGGPGFCALLAEAFDAMAAGPVTAPLLPPGHPLDLFTTATDFAGHGERIALHSPPAVVESEHRVSIGFSAITPARGGHALAALPELVLAGRATASFPGAFPPLTLAEIDALLAARGQGWPGREAFLARILPAHSAAGTLDQVALIDGSVLVNAPFAEAMAVLQTRPAHREIDRRMVYIDPCPTPAAPPARAPAKPPGFVPVVLAALSTIPRSQPIRDNLEQLAERSRAHAHHARIVAGLRGDVEAAVETLFGHTFFLDHPTASRLSAWRTKAQQAAATGAGYAYQAYARLKVEGALDALAGAIGRANGDLPAARVRQALGNWAAGHLPLSTARGGGLPATTVAFLRAHDLAHRIRRLRLMARRLAEEEARALAGAPGEIEQMRDVVWQALSLFFDRESELAIDAATAARVFDAPGLVLEALAQARALTAADAAADTLLAAAFGGLSRPLRRFALLTYLGFAYYDVATFPLLRDEGLTEMDPVKVDRIAPPDAPSIRPGGVGCLRGTEFYNFGAFFSRAYRENDYLWGRLHGAERMLDLVASSADGLIDADTLREAKKALFLAILDEEQGRLVADPVLVDKLRVEVLASVALSR